MPPPFRLENVARVPKKKEKSFQVLHTKGVYSKGVKISDWEQYRSSEPIDKDPYAAKNYMLSHYNRLGIDPDQTYTTATKEMLKQIHQANEPVGINPNKYLINYYTYSDDIDCMKYKARNLCPKICADPYLTTSQDSYDNSTFAKMKRVAYPTIPFLKYRKFALEDPILSENKFYDEGFNERTINLQKNKVSQWISYNPLTYTYNDGSVPKGWSRRCVPLSYTPEK